MQNYFRTRREQLGMSQFELAVAVGVTSGAVSGWERGQIPGIDLVKSLAMAFGVSDQEIMNEMLEMSEARKNDAEILGG